MQRSDPDKAKLYAKFTRDHLQILCNIIHAFEREHIAEEIDNFVTQLGNGLKPFNAHFDVEKFALACGCDHAAVSRIADDEKDWDGSFDTPTDKL